MADKPTSQIIIYLTKDVQTRLEVRLEDVTDVCFQSLSGNLNEKINS